MAFVTEDGIQVVPVRPIAPTDEQVARTQDGMIVRMRETGLTWRQIGKIMRMTHAGARYRYLVMNPVERERYARRSSLG